MPSPQALRIADKVLLRHWRQFQRWAATQKGLRKAAQTIRRQDPSHQSKLKLEAVGGALPRRGRHPFQKWQEGVAQTEP